MESKKHNKHIVDLLRNALANRGMSRGELSQITGLRKRTISSILHGQREPTGEELLALGQALRIKPRELHSLVVPGPAKIQFRHTSGRTENASRTTSPDFDIQFAPEFSGTDVKNVLTVLAAYYRACGGVGFKIQFETEEALVQEPVHA